MPLQKKVGGRQELPGKTQQNCRCQHQNEEGNQFSVSDGFSASGPAAVIQYTQTHRNSKLV